MAATEPGRAYVIMDRYAAIQKARALRLSPTEYVVMDVLLRLADYRSHTWIGTAVELAGDVRTSPATIRATLRRFEELCLVEMRAPFKQHARAEVFIAVYDDLVVPARGRAPSPSSSVTAIPKNDAKPQVSEPEKADRCVLVVDSLSISDRLPEADPDRCYACGGPADGKPNYRGDPYCKACEDF